MTGALRRGLLRLRADGWRVAETAVAAGAAWAVAGLVVDSPFVAPVTAVIALAAGRARRIARAIEIVIGVTIGVVVADAIVLGLGTGTFVLMLVVALAMAAATLLGAGTVLVNQAGISAVLVVTIAPPVDGPSPGRVVAALIGGAVALAIGQLLAVRDPVRAMARAARPVADELARTLGLIGEALRSGDRGVANQALAAARSGDADLRVLFDAIVAAREAIALRLPGQEGRERLADYAGAAQQIDYAVRNSRVLARRVLAATWDGPGPSALARAIELLGGAVVALADELENRPDGESRARDLAFSAAETATTVLAEHDDLTMAMIVGQVRSMSLDLLRASGLSPDESQQELERRAGSVRPRATGEPRPAARAS